jgi:hypothetical protein
LGILLIFLENLQWVGCNESDLEIFRLKNNKFWIFFIRNLINLQNIVMYPKKYWVISSRSTNGIGYTNTTWCSIASQFNQVTQFVHEKWFLKKTNIPPPSWPFCPQKCAAIYVIHSENDSHGCHETYPLKCHLLSWNNVKYALYFILIPSLHLMLLIVCALHCYVLLVTIN